MEAQGDFTLERVADNGHVELRLQGRLELTQGGELWNRLHAEASGSKRITLDLSQLESLDGGAAALLVEARAKLMAQGVDVEVTGVPDDARSLLVLYGCDSPTACLKAAPRRVGVFEQIGNVTVGNLREARDILAFVGDLLVATMAAIRRPRTVHWRDVGMLMEKAGADGLPIVLLINLLVGMILALQSGEQLARYGATIFVADLVGLSVVRELGPLMTAIVVAGRSGAAFAAELGTMKVSEEVDALRTLGQDPLRFLVFPRLLALLAVVPMLTLLADMIACFGGMIIAILALDMTAISYLNRLQERLDLWDVFGGLLKSAVFAVTITLVACRRGLATRGDAAGVGASTTSAVVIILFALVALDAVFTLLFSLLGI